MDDDLKGRRDELLSSVKGFFTSEAGEDSEAAQRKDQLVHFFKTNKRWLPWVALLIIILIGSNIRVQNFGILKDVVTGDYVSTDLDSHIYLKYAREILSTGSLAEVDEDRFVPLGAPTANYAFPAYCIYYLYKIMHFFDPTVTIYYADIIYPVVAFALGMVFFFLLLQKVFDVKTALIGTGLLAVMPAFLQRTMGGSSDHDVLGMMFMFLALYTFIAAWEKKSTSQAMIWGALAGIATGLTGLSWGSWRFLYVIAGVFVLLQFLLHKVEERHLYLYALWILSSVVVMISWVPLFPLKFLFTSPTTALTLFMLLVLAIDRYLYPYLLSLSARLPHSISLKKVPRAIGSFGIALVLGIVLVSILLGPAELGKQINEAKNLLLHPMGKDRWELTVAEQHQPYFNDWVSQFGPFLLGIPLLFALFIIGILLCTYQLWKHGHGKFWLIMGFLLMLGGIAFSRYRPDSWLNGASRSSVVVYFGSLAVVAVAGLYFYFKLYSHKKEEFDRLSHWDSKLLFALIWVFFMLIAMRGAIRLTVVFAPVIAALAGYALAQLALSLSKLKNKWYVGIGAIVLLLIVFSPFAAPFSGIVTSSYAQSLQQAKYSGAPYNAQWQLAGAWVRENIAKDAVFGHWWDYGYWVQNGWDRASVLDGANKVKYWNYLMGRHVLAGQTQEEALEFLQPHKATHYLIVAEEIGKYTAYSSIGSDADYDRYSWITTFGLNTKESKETRNGSILFYQGGYALDDDFVWKGKVYPRNAAGIGAVLVPVQQVGVVKGNETIPQMEFNQPAIALVMDNQRVDVPLKCLYFEGQMILFLGEGYPGCFRFLPALDGNGQVQNPIGGGLLVSGEGMKALWVNLYVFEQKNPAFDTSAFKLVYNSEGYLPFLALVQGRLMGPIKIWEINYPEGFTVDEETKAAYLGGNELLPDYFFVVR